MPPYGPKLAQCPHYEPAPADGLAVLKYGCPVGTCLGCGGRPDDGPSCNCPVFGESDEDD